MDGFQEIFPHGSVPLTLYEATTTCLAADLSVRWGYCLPFAVSSTCPELMDSTWLLTISVKGAPVPSQNRDMPFCGCMGSTSRPSSVPSRRTCIESLSDVRASGCTNCRPPPAYGKCGSRCFCVMHNQECCTHHYIRYITHLPEPGGRDHAYDRRVVRGHAPQTLPTRFR